MTSSADPPVLFVHGNGNSAAVWQTTLWRFESNGYDPSRLFAVDFTAPASPADDRVPEPNRSTTGQALAELAAAVDRIQQLTGRPKITFVGCSRGGNTIRNFIKHGGGHRAAALAVLCGTPSHGVFVADDAPGSEWNQKGEFLTRLNAGSEVHPGVRFVTIRSDRHDRYAQPARGPDSRGRVEGVGYDGPALHGAENLVLAGLDHREVAFHPRAFREIYRCVRGHVPLTTSIARQSPVRLDGIVSGECNGQPTNLPLGGVTVEVFETDSASGERRGAMRYRRTTEPDGRWGPFIGRAEATYEIVVAAPGYPVTHFFRSPFPRSGQYVHLTLRRLPPGLGDAGSAVTISRPRGYFGLGRDSLTIDGEVPDGIPPGVPSVSRATRRFPGTPSRSVRTELNGEVIVVRTFPLAAGHLTVAVFHY